MAEESRSADADSMEDAGAEPIEDADANEEPEVPDEEAEEVEAPDEPEERGSGPGFLRGTLLGVLAGAVAATLFAPPTGEEAIDDGAEQPESSRAPAGEDEGEEAPAGPLASVLGQVRARLDEARGEAGEAAREAEAKTRARFAELKDQD